MTALVVLGSRPSIVARESLEGQGGALPAIPTGIVEQLVQGPMTPSESQDLFLSLQKASG